VAPWQMTRSWTFPRMTGRVKRPQTLLWGQQNFIPGKHINMLTNVMLGSDPNNMSLPVHDMPGTSLGALWAPTVQGQSPLITNLTSSISDHVPLKFRESIWAGNFIELASLLKKDYISGGEVYEGPLNVFIGPEGPIVCWRESCQKARSSVN
jgi:hypothetical protein